jgi:hypothetical protein
MQKDMIIKTTDLTDSWSCKIAGAVFFDLKVQSVALHSLT